MKKNGITIAETALDVVRDYDMMVAAMAFVWEPLPEIGGMTVIDQMGAMERCLGFKCIKFEDDTMIMVFDFCFSKFMELLAKHGAEVNATAMCCA